MDWKTLIAEIQEAGLSQSEIGRRIDKSQAWVSAAAAGKYDDLKWSDGEALRKLHAEEVATDRRSGNPGRRASNGKTA